MCVCVAQTWQLIVIIFFFSFLSIQYQHEISPDADGAAMGETFTTGWFALTEGDVMPFVDQVWPDFKWGYFGQSQNIY